MGFDSDHPRAEGEVGKTGVAIDSIEDMRRLFAEIPLDRVSTSMTINATAPILLLLYELVAEEQGVAADALSGTVQNDILKEYAARGTYIYPPDPSMRLITDLFAYCNERIPKWNTISISGYHMREAGATAAQEIAFTLADGIAYVQAAIDAGLAVDDFAPRLSFFFACHQHFFEEIAKFRAARRLWARIMRERFGRDRRAVADAAVPHADRRRDAHRAAAGEQHRAHDARGAVGRARRHAVAPHERLRRGAGASDGDSAKIALRTQQVIGLETGVGEVVDPLGGSYYVEALTDELERLATAYIEKVDGLGGAVAAIEQGFYQDEIHEAAFRIQQAIERGDRVVVGVNRFQEDEDRQPELQRIGEDEVAAQVARLRELRATRDQPSGRRRAPGRGGDGAGTANLLPPMREALRARATLGEVSDVLRDVFGEYRPTY